jgi:acetolactate synthase-1/2/3 large subunit
MKYSDLLGQWLRELGYTHCFFVAGGGIMHLLDGFRNRFECIPVVHEMTAGICAEHFNQTVRGPNRAFALVTTGPGLTNIVTAVAGCYVEHRELLVIAGQVKSTDLLKFPERQRGVQEVDGAAVCSPIAIRTERLEKPISRASFQSLVKLAKGPHPGPVVVEVCLDVQGAAVDSQLLSDESDDTLPVELEPAQADIDFILDLVKDAKRPLILIGGLVTRPAAWAALSAFERLGMPVATTTSAIDRVPTHSPIFAGRPGTWGGQRAGNLIVAQADVLVVFGAQLDLQQTGFNYEGYAPQAKLIHIFPSKMELDRIGPPAIRKVLATPDLALAAIASRLSWKDEEGWGRYVKQVRTLVSPLEPLNTSKPGFINSFVFLRNLSRATKPTDVLAMCSSGGTFTGALQNYEVHANQSATTSAAHASMGYGLATSVGAAFANPSQRVVLTEGEGGFSQNLQELATVSRFSLPIKIFLFDNAGYASIRATQKKFFNGAYLGCDPDTGLGFPNWEILFKAFNVPCRYLLEDETEPEQLAKLLDGRAGPEAWIVRVDPDQTNWPAVSTVLSTDGSMTSAPLYDMIPKLTNEVRIQISKYLPI